MDTRNFCKAFNEEVQKQLRDDFKKMEDQTVAEYNKKYTDKGMNPPLFETEKIEGGFLRRYPDGHIDFHYRHTWEAINPACKD